MLGQRPNCIHRALMLVLLLSGVGCGGAQSGLDVGRGWWCDSSDTEIVGRCYRSYDYCLEDSANNLCRRSQVAYCYEYRAPVEREFGRRCYKTSGWCRGESSDLRDSETLEAECEGYE